MPPDLFRIKANFVSKYLRKRYKVLEIDFPILV